MTTRIPVSTVQNEWADAQTVDKSDLDTEQTYNNQAQSAIVQNFFGSGVLLETPEPNIIFDSDIEGGLLTSEQAALIAAGNFDGTGIDPHNQPSDINLGNQLAITLSDSLAYGRYCTKIAIIGLSFDDQLIQDKFYFYTNETQVTSKHYKRILSIFFNDFLGNNNCSRYLGGRVIIREAKPFELSRDAKSVAQDIEPDIFWRDFKTSDPLISLWSMIQTGIGAEYNADDLEINITGRQPHRSIEPADVTTRIGQKFKATTDNIQKITLLMGVEKGGTDYTDWYDWDGDLVIGIHALQTSVDNPYDIVPELAIDFEPQVVPLAEISYSQAELKSLGYVLTDVAQPLDFVFTNTSIANPGGIVVGNYYVVTFRRSGASTTGTIFAEVGNDRIDNSRLTVYNTIWVDSSDEDLWFQVWSDSCKVADGQGYDLGSGIKYDKTTTDPDTGASIDNEKRHFSFVNTGESTVNTGILQASLQKSITTQDERTGDNIYSRKEYVPGFSFLTSSGLSDLRETSDPLVIGCVADNNPKTSTLISKSQTYPGLARGNVFTVINPDPDLLSIKLMGRKLLPQQECASYEYRIFATSLCTDGYGDVNGDGTIDSDDINRATELIGEGLASLSTQQKLIDGTVTTLEILRADVNGDGYVTAEDVELITNYVNRTINSFPVGTSFRHLDITVQNSVGRFDGYWECDGYVIIDGYQIDPSTLTPEEREYYGNPGLPSIDTDNAVFTTMPFAGVNYQIEYQPFWQDYLLSLSSSARVLPATFSYTDNIDTTECNSGSVSVCNPVGLDTPTCDPGRNDFYLPGNLIIDQGTIIRPNGDPVKPDFEIKTITLELPKEIIFSESLINVFDTFCVDRGDGFTSKNYLACRYYDCTTVQPEDLSLDRIRFNVSIQSFVPNLDGYSAEDGYGIIIDTGMGVNIDHTTGILKITAADLDQNDVYRSMITKLQIIVYLKKSGWNNPVLIVAPNEIAGLLV